VAYVKYPNIYQEGAENHKTFFRIAGVMVEIRIEHRYTNLITNLLSAIPFGIKYVESVILQYPIFNLG
jgi:hypothetical protein